MTITLTPPPIAMSDAELRHRIAYLDRTVRRTSEAGQYLEHEAYQDALDACLMEHAGRTERAEAERVARERAERGAGGLDAIIRALDAVACEVAYAEIAERR